MGVDTAAAESPNVLILSSSLLVDRIFLHTRVLDELSSEVKVNVWALSNRNPNHRPAWDKTPGLVEDFPEVGPFKEFPYNYLRRLNEYAWDFRQRPISRLSMARHVRDRSTRLDIRALKVPARLIAGLGLEVVLENWLEKLLLGYERSAEAAKRMRRARPAVAVITGPFQAAQPAIAACAKNLGIPVMALIPSWDNITTKNRPVFKYDGYLVWSEQTKRELHKFYPVTRKTPVYVVGAPQFDVFFQERFRCSRKEFSCSQGLESDRPIILYAIGSPNFLKGEWQGAVALAERIVRGDLGDVQMIVRPHPLHDKGELMSRFQRFHPRVVVQEPVGSNSTWLRSQDESKITEWVNTFTHSDVVINLSSTVMIDAAICDRPVVNLDYDPGDGQPQQQLIKEINHLWDHIKPVVESGAVWLVSNEDELVHAVKTYLAQPELHRDKRQWLTEYVCGHVNGQSGERMASAILNFVRLQEKKARRSCQTGSAPPRSAVIDETLPMTQQAAADQTKSVAARW